MYETPRVAIIGLGSVALNQHIPAVRKAGGEVIALVDVVPGMAAKAAADKGVPHAFESVEAMLSDAEVDLVSVCTPSIFHHQVAMAAIAAGKHLFVEKPACANAAEITEVAAAAEAAGLCLLAGSHHPYRENVTHLRDRIEGGDLGEVYAIDCFKLRRAAAPLDRGHEKRPQGVAFFSSVHRIDVSLFLMGNPRPRFVTARTYNHFALDKAEREGVLNPSGLVEDSLIATIHFENGCTLTLRDIQTAHMEEPNEMHCWFGDLTVLGTLGGARLHPLTIFETLPDGGQLVSHPSVSSDLNAGHYPAYAYLFECLRSGERPVASPARAINAMRILDAIYASASQGGRQVEL